MVQFHQLGLGMSCPNLTMTMQFYLMVYSSVTETSVISNSHFENYTVDISFYLFNWNTFNWKKIEGVEANPRAYFSCVNVQISGISSLVYIGGCQKTKDSFMRLSYSDIIALKFINDGQFQTENLVLANSPDVGISSLSSISRAIYFFVLVVLPTKIQ